LANKKIAEMQIQIQDNTLGTGRHTYAMLPGCRDARKRG